MDGRMDGQMDAWVDGGRDRQGQIDGYMNKKITHDKLLKKSFRFIAFISTFIGIHSYSL